MVGSDGRFSGSAASGSNQHASPRLHQSDCARNGNRAPGDYPNARLQMLGDASRQLEQNQQDPAPLQQAMLAASQSEKNAREEKWRSRCEEAHMERQAGHLLAANDLILQILVENESFPDAQRELSELQSQIRRTLDSGEGATVIDRFALEGFYAYGQAIMPRPPIPGASFTRSSNRLTRVPNPRAVRRTFISLSTRRLL